jgi:hypothetical protein
MTSPVSTPQIVQMNDKSSWEAVRQFQDWMSNHPEVSWTSVTVIQNQGLRLSSADTNITLQFITLNCGYNGNGPISTVELLELAGFGDKAYLEPIIFTSSKVFLGL